jgi:hypothetical protein
MSCGYITDHDRTCPWVMVRLPKAHPDALRDLLRGAHGLALSERRPRRTTPRG